MNEGLADPKHLASIEAAIQRGESFVAFGFEFFPFFGGPHWFSQLVGQKPDPRLRPTYTIYRDGVAVSVEVARLLSRAGGPFSGEAPSPPVEALRE